MDDQILIPLDIQGGMNTRDDPSVTRGRGFRMARNIRRGEGTIKQRPGWTKVKASGITGYDTFPYPFFGGYSIKKRDGTVREIVVGGNGNIYDTTVDPPLVMTLNKTTAVLAPTWGTTHRASFAQWKDDIYIALGSTGGSGLNLRVDGTADEVFAAGMAAPAACAAAAGGAGSITGDRYYRVMFYDTVKGYPSAPGATSTKVTVSAKEVELTGIPLYTGEGRTIHRKIEVSSDGAAWYELTTIENNTAEIYTDDVNLLATDLEPASTRYENIWACKYVLGMPDGLLLWANDVTNSLPARAYRSASSAKPEELATAYVDVGDTGEPITGMCRWNNGALVAKRDSLHYVPRNVSRSQMVVENIGCVGHNTLVPVEGGVAFLSEDGPRFFNGQSAPFVGRDGAGGGGSMSFELKRTWDTIAQDMLDDAFGISLKEGGESLVIWFVSDGSSTYDLVGMDIKHNWSTLAIVWDLRRNQLSIDDFFCGAAWDAHVASSLEKCVHGLFPYGIVGRLNSGIGDGYTDETGTYDEFAHGGVLSATDTTIVTDRTRLPYAGDGLMGTRVHIWDGTGEDAVAYVYSNTSTTLYTTTLGLAPHAPDTTSKWVIGRELFDADIPGFTAGEHGLVFSATELQVTLAPESN